VIFSSPAAAQPFPTFPFHPITAGNTYVVNTTADPSGPGGCSSTPEGECSFRQAVDSYDQDKGVGFSPYLHVINQDQITFAPCVPSQETICPSSLVYNILTDGYVVFDNPYGVSVTVTGNGQAVTIIQGGEACSSECFADLQILGISAASVTLSDLTIEDGYAPQCGGGILNSGGTVTVNDSTIKDNQTLPGLSQNGGGICNLNGTFNLNDSNVLGNIAYENGGGIYNSGGVLQITGSLISDNQAGDGAGIYNAAVGGTSAWLFSGTSVIDNLAGTGDGGGIYNGNFLEVLQSEVAGNTAFQGGGVFNACGAFYPGGGAGVTGNTPDNVYQQTCSSFPLPPGLVFPGFPLGSGFPPGIGSIDPVP
jgi:hypothetical protein